MTASFVSLRSTWPLRRIYSGTAPLTQIAEALDLQIEPDDDYDTLAGLILAHLTTIPADGSKPVLDACGLHIQVDRVAEHRIESAIVSVIRPAENEEDKSGS